MREFVERRAHIPTPLFRLLDGPIEVSVARQLKEYGRLHGEFFLGKFLGVVFVGFFSRDLFEGLFVSTSPRIFLEESTMTRPLELRLVSEVSKIIMLNG